MKRIGISSTLKRLDEPAPQHFVEVSVSDELLPTTPDELPYNAITLDGTAATVVTLTGALPTTVVR